ncbi:MAG: HAMP domain-containing histidine kinase [Bacteroidales bacterium]|nr:HAMP domain-containing histidine kinase [Bacteroidales bacterium]
MEGIKIYASKQRWKMLLFLLAVLIGIGSLLYTNTLVKTLSQEERKKVQLWAEATALYVQEESNDLDMSLFITQIIQNNTTVPVILVDDEGKMMSRNLDSIKLLKRGYLEEQLEVMKEQNPPIQIVLNNGQKNFIYFKESTILTKLTWYPYIQLALIILFILVAYFAFSSSRHAEQNQVWVGLSKETAHQLGTPASSLSAWVEVLRYHVKDEAIINELEKDVNRLKIITERFSKIGSMPKMGPVNLRLILENVIDYIKNRSSDKSQITLHLSNNNIIIPLNISLFEWVIENLLKNSLDAMQGKGVLKISVSENKEEVFVDISDSGKGIPKKLYKTIFKPGYTTKSRGWGLGLSLAKRIIEMYHRGKIYVLHSEIDKGTTIRIILKKAL